MRTLQLENKIVKIKEGELVSYSVDGHEFIHQKGSLGWGSSDTEMFPIIGPVNEAGFMVQVPKANAVQDQHGHLRLLSYDLAENSGTSATFVKEYKAGTPVTNKKYPEKSDKALLVWPYSFRFEKFFSLTDQALEIRFKVSGERDMPYMLGYHPAFKLTTDNPIIKNNHKQISLAEVLAVGSRALEVPNCNEITLVDEKRITIKTEGFGHFMCWTEVNNMVCIEPITFYPYSVEQRKLHEGFQYLNNEKTFKVKLISGD
ncbi:aldose 1-epimerase [Croceitalea rosinachiae]|uniref:Aldose 1-epimerase n=1 Tax=Croceitalea rosinachiae TaxID=3075596 RepID=A0ABU3ACU4_9FLAO|nr:aldose 1-epimerase [Croceitalea sp. F388]MDT0607999.1 aldose 1-epimerase [Croceitalea sp. F388]